ncbi:MAG: hypothetical protein ACT4PI_17820 [Actinomycetota bacterium]
MTGIGASEAKTGPAAVVALACGLGSLIVGALFTYVAVPIAIVAIGLGLWAASQGERLAMAWTAVSIGVASLAIAVLFFALT